MPDPNNPSDKDFEEIRVTINDLECRSARLLMPLLGYDKWDNFIDVIKKAQVACANSGQLVDKHFFPTSGKNTGKGRPAVDYLLTRYACYLVAQNGDPRKPEVAIAMTYFAAQTIRQEEYDQLSDGDKRMYVRAQVKEGTRKLNSSAKQHGVKNYAYFHGAGYKGLYDMFLGQIKQAKGIGSKENLLDRAGTTELAANLFRITQTEERLHKDLDEGKRHGQQGAQLIHFEIGSKVRQAIREIGGTLPENLQPEEDIKKLERRIKKADKALSKPAEKRLKIEGGFDDTMSKIAKTKPPKQ
jgi:DNA-damage-inducible protein D